MSRAAPTLIELTEYVPHLFAPAEIPADAAEILWRRYAKIIAVEFPSPKTGNQWQLTAQGWTGYIPLTPELHLSLQPRVELGNLFRMLAYAYRLKSFHLLDGLMACRSLKEFYEQLAYVLARRVLDRSRQGLYRAYLARSERLPYLRGRLAVAEAVRSPVQARLTCHYEESTVDNPENQILSWTLWRIARSGLCTEQVLPVITRAYRAMQGLVTLAPYPPEACVGRSYNRLNEDYRALHALCRFFLEQSGPGQAPGDQAMIPFLVHMPRLYEQFVAEWLRLHLPPGLALERQARVNVDEGENLHFEIDLVLYQAGERDVARSVLDTKYKTMPGPSTDDIAQVVTYAQAKGCHEAILVYPAPLARPLDSWIGDIRVRSLTFDLGRDLEAAGQRFLHGLLAGG